MMNDKGKKEGKQNTAGSTVKEPTQSNSTVTTRAADVEAGILSQAKRLIAYPVARKPEKMKAKTLPDETGNEATRAVFNTGPAAATSKHQTAAAKDSSILRAEKQQIAFPKTSRGKKGVSARANEADVDEHQDAAAASKHPTAAANDSSVLRAEKLHIAFPKASRDKKCASAGAKGDEVDGHQDSDLSPNIGGKQVWSDKVARRAKKKIASPKRNPITVAVATPPLVPTQDIERDSGIAPDSNDSLEVPPDSFHSLAVSEETKEEQNERQVESLHTGPAAAPASNIRVSNSCLVEATPVVGESNLNLGEAEAVDLGALESKKKKRKRQHTLWAVGVVTLVVACIVGVVLGVVLSRDSGSDKAAPLATAANESAITPSPTTISPSMFPSAAPTMLIEDLPKYTINSLADPFSPQFEAHFWLSNHQDLWNMTDWRKKQLFALATFYYSMKGREWPRALSQDWLLDDRSECDWYSESYREEYTEGFDDSQMGLYPCYTCERSTCDEEGRFRTLRLTSLNVNGTKIPPEIALLTSLVTLSLPNCNIGGQFASELGLLSSLVDLDLAVNSLSGNLPSEIGMMTSMTKLLMNDNDFSGTIPTEVGRLSKLGWFVANANNLNGTLPQSIGQVTTLYDLGLSENQMTGTIPSELGLVTWLGILGLDSNSFSGVLPTELGLLDPPIRTNINGKLMIPPNSYDDQGYDRRELYSFQSRRHLSWARTEEVLMLNFSHNNFRGTIPLELADVARNASFMQLYLQNNSFYDTIPSEFCFVSEIGFDCSEQLCGCECVCLMTLPPNFDPQARTAQMHGYILEQALSQEEELEHEGSPQQLALNFLATEDALFLDVPSAEGYQLTTRYALSVLYYSTNGSNWLYGLNFLQPVDHCLWYNVTGIRTVSCDGNGQIVALHLAGNDLSGSLPAELGLLTTLTNLNLESNWLSGPIPWSIVNLSLLQELHLADNFLNGSLVEDMGVAWPLLWKLSLGHNSFSGGIPSEWGLMMELNYLFLNNNFLGGTIPSELHSVGYWCSLDLSNNALSGPIPTEFALFYPVFSAYLEHNLLSGPLPSQLGLMTVMGDLYLNNNNLTGRIPTQMGLMSSLDQLYLGGNSLTGRIPLEFGNMTDLEAVDLSSCPLLTGSIPQEFALLTSLGHLNVSGSSALSGTIPQELCYLQDKSCTFGYSWATRNCSLDFDCTSILCGCDCTCPDA